jgi:hypothetical protein
VKFYTYLTLTFLNCIHIVNIAKNVGFIEKCGIQVGISPENKFIERDFGYCSEFEYLLALNVNFSSSPIALILVFNSDFWLGVWRKWSEEVNFRLHSVEVVYLPCFRIKS